MSQERYSLEIVRTAYGVLFDRYLAVSALSGQLNEPPPDITQFEQLRIQHPPSDEVLQEKAPAIMALFEEQRS